MTRSRAHGAPDVLVPSAVRVFAAVAEHGGVTAAARVLGLSQPAVTAAIHKLEAELETTLFLRTSRGVTLTATGQAMLEHARRIERAAVEARREIGGLEEEPRGRFTIGCHESLGAYFLPPLFAHFFAEHPGIDLVLSNANSREIERAVIERRVDFGVVVNPESHPESVVTPLFVDRVAIVAHAGLLGKKKGDDGAAVIGKHALVHVPALRQTQFILGALDQAGIVPKRVVPCVSLELVKSLVLDRAGLGILPLRVARYHTPKDTVRVVSRSLPSFDDRIALVRRADLHVTAAARLVLDAFAARGRELTRHPQD
jgi:DNA-binding transcriptional LysR family regulator